MKVSRSEGLANHTGPESCGAAREDGVEALTGEGAGRVFSRETYKLRNADALRAGGRHNRIRHYREALPSSARSQTPSTYRTLERSHESTNRKQFLVRCLPARPASAFAANADEQQELSRRAASTRTGWNHALTKGAANLMQRLARLPTAPHVDPLLGGKPVPFSLCHKHHL